MARNHQQERLIRRFPLHASEEAAGEDANARSERLPLVCSFPLERKEVSGDYAFTTLRPVPALTRIEGVLVQLLEIPGLLAGANDDRGGGRALLGVLRNADAMLLCTDAGASLDGLQAVRAEVAAAGPTATSSRS